MSKPTIVIVHGAQHVPAHFNALSTILQEAGYRVVAPPLPCSHSEVAIESMDPDVEAVRHAVEAELGTNDVLVCAHSYGGIVASLALEGLAKTRQKGSYGVSSIVYLAAMIPDKGRSVLDERPGDREMLDSGLAPLVSLNCHETALDISQCTRLL